MPHTPGPWKQGSCDSFIIWADHFRSTEWTDCPEPAGERAVIASAECPPWARIDCDGETREKWIAECKANAALIAAAPEMLKFIERVRDFAREGGDDALYAEADALLEKATPELEAA